MKKKMVMVLLAVLFLVVGTAFAENVKVVKGMTLWRIAELCGERGINWVFIKDVNPQLPPMVTRNFRSVVIIKPGQVLALPLGWSLQSETEDLVQTDSPVTPEPKVEEVLLVDPKLNFGSSAPPKPDADAQQAMQRVAEKFAKAQEAEKKAKASREFWEKTIPLILFLLCLALIGGAILYFLGREIRRWYYDPDRRPAVILGGLSSDSQASLPQIGGHYPGRYTGSRRLKAVEQGIAVRESGPKSFVVDMVFGDGKTRKAEIKPGDKAHRVELMDGTYENYRSHCGNLMGEIKDGKFDYPDGWYFLRTRGSRYEVPQPQPAEVSTEVETPVAEAPVGEPTAPVVGDDSQSPVPEVAPVADVIEPALAVTVEPEKTAPETPSASEGGVPLIPVVAIKPATEVDKPTKFTVSVTFKGKNGDVYTVTAESSTLENQPSKMERTVGKDGSEKVVVMMPNFKGKDKD
jgi:hypothetical protein